MFFGTATDIESYYSLWTLPWFSEYESCNVAKKILMVLSMNVLESYCLKTVDTSEI